MKKLLFLITVATSLSIFGANLNEGISPPIAAANIFYLRLTESVNCRKNRGLVHAEGIEPFIDKFEPAIFFDTFVDILDKNLRKYVLGGCASFEKHYTIGSFEIELKWVNENKNTSIKSYIMEAISREKIKNKSSIWQEKNINTFEDLIKAVTDQRIQCETEWYKEFYRMFPHLR